MLAGNDEQVTARYLENGGELQPLEIVLAAPHSRVGTAGDDQRREHI